MYQFKQIKYLEFSLSRSKQLNKKTEYIFYLLLKQVKVDGLFKTYDKKNGGYLLDIQSQVLKDTGQSYSITRISQLIQRLVKQGFIKTLFDGDDVFGYQLVSYEDVWEQVLKINKGVRTRQVVFRFRINKTLLTKRDLIEKIFESEIVNKIEVASQVHRKALGIDIFDPSLKEEQYIKKNLSPKGFLTKSSLLIDQIVSTRIPFAIPLSCKGIAKSFGYKTTAVGHKIKKRLIDNGSIIRNKSLESESTGVRKPVQFFSVDIPANLSTGFYDQSFKSSRTYFIRPTHQHNYLSNAFPKSQTKTTRNLK